MDGCCGAPTAEGAACMGAGGGGAGAARAGTFGVGAGALLAGALLDKDNIKKIFSWKSIYELSMFFQLKL